MVEVMERILRSGSLEILFDSNAVVAPEPGWFDPDWWRARGRLRGELGGRGQALAVESPHGPAVLRIYHRGGMVRRLSRSSYLFAGRDRTRPFREWRITRTLYDAGLPVPEPLAAAYSRRGPLYTAAMLTRRIQPATSLPASAGALEASDWQVLGRTLTRFAAAGLRHPDLNATNILVDPERAFWLLDFDRAALAPGPTDPGPMLRRLERSLAKLGIAHDRGAIARGIAAR